VSSNTNAAKVKASNDKMASVNVKFDFMKHRKIFFRISITLVVLGILMLSIFGLNFGVDFKAGTNMDITVAGQAPAKAKVDQILSGLKLTSIPTIGGSRISVRFDEVLDTVKVNEVKAAFNKEYGDKTSYEVNTVSPDIAKELGVKAIIAVLIASLAICIYVSIRFEWRFAVAAIIAILHDAFIVIAMFAIFRLEVNLPFIAAVLTTIGYSINDKIVIFDRIRENQRFAKIRSSEDLSNMINQSIWQTMARNVYTVLTVLIAAGCLYIFGSDSIKLFALAKLIGLTCGAYSSICTASPLWFLFKQNSQGSKKKAAA
jgi:preprotein translocase subunit SecF